MPQAAAIMLVGTPGRWLMVRRPEPPHEWAIPGGLIERGEKPAAAAIRETTEETDVHGTAVVFLGVVRDRGRDVYVFVARSWTGRARAREGIPVGWGSWNQLRLQAVRYGTFLDVIAKSYRARFGVRP